MTSLHACVCGAIALTVLFPLAVLFLRMLGAARWQDLRDACWIAAGVWGLVAIAWIAGVR